MKRAANDPKRTFPILRSIPIAALVRLDYRLLYGAGVRTQAPQLIGSLLASDHFVHLWPE